METIKSWIQGKEKRMKQVIGRAKKQKWKKQHEFKTKKENRTRKHEHQGREKKNRGKKTKRTKEKEEGDWVRSLLDSMSRKVGLQENGKHWLKSRQRAWPEARVAQRSLRLHWGSCRSKTRQRVLFLVWSRGCNKPFCFLKWTLHKGMNIIIIMLLYCHLQIFIKE